MTGQLLGLAIMLAALPSDPMGGGTQPGELTVKLADNTSCALCHSSASDVRMPSTSYRGTMMDLAGVDPIFLAALEVAVEDNPAASELCLKCHYPRAWLDGRLTTNMEQGFGLEEKDLQGIQCDLCHRMAVPPPVDGATSPLPAALSGLLPSNAQVFLHDDTVKRGPFGSEAAIGHGAEASPLFTSSALCAQCHDVDNTFREQLGPDGQGLGTPVAIERTFSEWRQSAYGDENSPQYKTCMGCHMQSYVGVSSTIGSPPTRELRSHRIVGSNTIAPRMVDYLHRTEGGPAFLDNLGPDIERTVVAARQQLMNSAVLDVRGLIVSDSGPRLRVRVTNLTGHKLPTGYAEGRRMWVGHAVEFPNGETGSRSGTPDVSTWDFTPGEEPARIWEVQFAEGTDASHSFHFAAVDRLIKDNRIPPKGFVPTSDTAPYGHSYPTLDSGALAHFDEIDLPLLGSTSCWPAITSVRLYFQAASGTYLRFLIENSATYGPSLEAALDEIGAAPELMEELKVVIYPDGRVQLFDEEQTYPCESGPEPPPAVAPPSEEEEPASGEDAVGPDGPLDDDAPDGSPGGDVGQPAAEIRPSAPSCAQESGTFSSVALLSLWLASFLRRTDRRRRVRSQLA
ncbi:MAG: multiheme c-type cytochrome [Myxococcota bacterium]